MPTSWYDTSFRKLFFDFPSAGAAVGLAARFDAERWAERVQEANAQAVSVFTKCGFGYSFDQKGTVRYQHPHLPAGLDMLEAQITALHKRGLRALGYYHTFNSEPIARDHPNWIERDADGKPRGLSICLLSPLLVEWMLPHVEEIVTNYAVDALFFDGTYAHSPCHCAACQTRFAEASGGLAVPKDKQDPAWPRFVAWKLAALQEVRQSVCDTIHRHRPEVVVAVNWAYTPRMPEVVPAGLGALVADIHPDDQVFEGSYLSSYWALLERPFDVMNAAFLQWWGDWGCKPALAMQQEVAPVLAHGGLTWVGYQMTHEFDVAPAVMGELGKTLAFVREREPLLVGAESVPHVAVLHSTEANHPQEEVAFFVNEGSARGAHRLLTESMIPHHLVHEQTLRERLPEFGAVFLPDQRYLQPELVPALAEWVEAGGVLVATALTGTLDDDHRDTGRFALEGLLGIRYEGVYDQSHAYFEVTDTRLTPGTLDMPHLAEAKFAFARPVAEDVECLARLRKAYLRSDGQSLLRWSPVGEDSGYPAITLRPVGKGWAAYFAGDPFRAYQAKNQWNLKHVVANLLRLTLPDPPVEVEAPAWLEVVVRRQSAASAPDGGERLLVHLVNQHGDRPVDGNYRCTEQIVPVQGVVVRLRSEARPSRVTLEPAGAVPEWEHERGVTTVHVPAVDIHTVVAVAA
ncbi:MAG: hypothetical protein GW867_24985 [Armatimonadetes bacterium]|nr:hypothetical protein [Armatimonadota bacterium]